MWIIFVKKLQKILLYYYCFSRGDICCFFLEELLTKGDLNTFIQNTCWIQGVYVYREISKQLNQAAYYGITKDIDLDGLTADRKLCATRSHYGQRNEDCYAMEKTYFQQVRLLKVAI